MAHRTTWEGDGIHWNVFDTLDEKEVIEFSEELSDDPRLEKLAYFIWDSTKVTEIKVDKDDASLATEYSNLLNKYNKNIKGALVVTNNSLKILVQQYIDELKELKSTWELMIFESIDDARKWIHLKTKN